MKRIVLLLLLTMSLGAGYSQTIYYWVGGPAAANINTGSNWNTALNGSGSSRPSSSNAADILVFDGTNISGATPATGTIIAPVNGGITCAQVKFVNNVTVQLPRTTTGTGTINIAGDAGDDLVIEAGSNVTFNSTSGSVVFAMAASTSGIVSGNLTMNTSAQARIANTTAGTGKLVFKSGSTFTSNITGASSYAFGSSTQSAPGWVIFESGSDLYFTGGNSPMGSGNLSGNVFYNLELQPGSTWHHRATNTGAGNYFNRFSMSNVSVENGANFIATGSIYKIDNLTIDAGSTFTTHTSGQTVVLGNIVNNGTMVSDPTSTNELMIAGTGPRTISGAGTMNIASLIIANNATVAMDQSMNIDKTVRVYGKINFTTRQLSGNATFTADQASTPVATTGNLTAGSYIISGNTAVPTSARGWGITGTGIAPNTTIVAFSPGTDSIYLSAPLIGSGIGSAIEIQNTGAVLETANTNGFDPLTGSVTVLGDRNFEDNISYIINGATTTPVGISTGYLLPSVSVASMAINAPVTLNKGIMVSTNLAINEMLTVRPLDTVHILSGAVINGGFVAGKHIATGYSSTTGEQGVIRYDGLSAITTIPVGTAGHYMPVILTPGGSSEFSVSAFDGITENGQPNGTPLSPLQKLTVIDAVWNINRLNGTGPVDMTLYWSQAQEGTTFSTLPSTDIGLIQNNGTAYGLPAGVADNATNMVTATISSFGAFSIGAIPQLDPFVFNDIPVKTYGDPDFNAGATSLNTTQPIVYTSSNPAVATIVAGNVHITGAGTSDITATQATDGIYPAVSMTKTLTVEKALLTIHADTLTKFEGEPNPPLTATYTGFVLGETPSALLTPAVISTTATLASGPGVYPITVGGATSNNYTITFINAQMTVLPKQTQTITFPALTVKTYGNAAFPSNATTTNSTIPLVLTSSNPAVATISGTTIQIVGAGTATITASQAGSIGYFPATSIVRELVVNKAPLTIRVRDTARVQGQPNPPFTITYTGFVLGQNSSSLLTPVVATTDATINSSPGNYPIVLSGATSNNYAITYVNARLTVQFADPAPSQNLNAYMSNSSTLSVRLYSDEPRLADITMFDMNGKPLLKKNIFMPVGFVTSEISIPTIPSGIYIVSVKGEGVNLVQRIAIIK